MHSLAIIDRRVVDIPDVEQAPVEFAAGKRISWPVVPAVTMMPMLRGSNAIGVPSVVRLATGPLTDKQLSVLETFARQAVIAIENTRRCRELHERTEDLSGIAATANGDRRCAESHQPLDVRSASRCSIH